MDISLHMDGVGYAGADGCGFRGLMAEDPMTEKCTECEEHFAPLGGRNAKQRPVRSVSR